MHSVFLEKYIYIYITKFRILLLEIITSFLLKWVGTYIYKSYLLFLAFT